jgi:hypothetical protein
MNLVLSLAALALGPVLYAAFQKNDLVRSSLDGLLFVTIVGIVTVYIIPEVFDVAGIRALAFLVAGLLFAFLVEKHPAVGAGERYSWVILLGALGLVLHAAMDGIALLPGDHLHSAMAGSGEVHSDESGLAGLLSNHLAVGVILHRIPVGMAIWWTIRPLLGSNIAIGALVIIAVATSASYLLGEPVIAMLKVTSVACFQAFVAGTLLHVIVFSSIQRHAHPHIASHARTVVGERLGIIAGVILLFLVPHGH